MVTYIIVGIIIVFVLRLRLGHNAKRAHVVVLGDIGRSPRMQFHALSLANIGFQVCMFGYLESQPHSDLTDNALITLKNIPQLPHIFSYLPKLVHFCIKVVWQFVITSVVLLAARKPSHILLQNPPSLPAAVSCLLASWLQGCKFIIDWHNYGYTILALNLGAAHPLVRIHRWYERVFGRMSSHNICVTAAMSEDLLNKWNIRSVTLHDRPAKMFADLDHAGRHKLFHRLGIFHVNDAASSDNKEVTVFTEKDRSGCVSYRATRPVLLVSSTSWTEDEDFSLLLNALDEYDKSAAFESDLPAVICVITGKGPLKDHYLRIIDSKSWVKVKVHAPWLEAADYPRLLASADLGVCLHKSSSGLDLPMKVVDMFGCRLPVCAVSFPCLGELVKHDENGLIFSTESELKQQLEDLLRGFPDRCYRLQRYREELRSFQQLRWDDAWNEIVRPLFDDS